MIDDTLVMDMSPIPDGTTAMNNAEVKDLVRRRYEAFAETGGIEKGCCATMAPASGYATDRGLYSAEELARVSDGALRLSRGCGNPTGFAALQAGETVVDFGCGGGIDVILAAHKVGSAGRVIGVDAAAEMIERARANVAEAGLDGAWVDLQVTDLADTGLTSGCVDVVISNCVINLCPDKEAVYREAFRILRPGGRVAISDVVSTEELPAYLETFFRSTWMGCVGGAVAARRYFDMVQRVGFEHISVVSEHNLTARELSEMASCPGPQFTPTPTSAHLDAVHGKISTIKFTADKPR